MKLFWVLALSCLLPVSFALTLGEALASAPSRPDAVSANLELLTARNDLIRIAGDPLALRMDRVQAEQAVEQKRAELEAAYYSGLVDIANAYTGVLQARKRLELTQKGLALAQDALDIAQIRVENGSATQLDLQEADVSVQDAQKNALTAEKALTIAVNNLESLIGKELTADALEPLPESYLVTLPPLDDAQRSAQRHPQLLQVAHGLELANLGVDMLDPKYASASQIEASRTQLETTRELVQEAQRGYNLQVRNLYLQAESAADTYQVAQESLANAQERLGFQRDRLAAGLIADIVFRQSELEALQAELETLQARHDYLTALLNVPAATLVALPGPELLRFEEIFNLPDDIRERSDD